MLMCKQMVLTIFIIAVASGTITEFQIFIIRLGPPADCTLVVGIRPAGLFDRFIIGHLPMHLLR